jgi:hypothetical protein
MRDFIVTLPAILSIHHTFPIAGLIPLDQPWHKQFLKKKEGVLKKIPIERVIVIPPMKEICEAQKIKPLDRSLALQ